MKKWQRERLGDFFFAHTDTLRMKEKLFEIYLQRTKWMQQHYAWDEDMLFSIVEIPTQNRKPKLAYQNPIYDAYETIPNQLLFLTNDL